jgi:predicted PurR-regulated permease PerM
MGIAILFFILYIGQDIIIPLVFAIMIAILLNPVILFLCRIKIPRVLAIILSLVVTMLMVAVALPMLLALATKQPIDAFYVLVAYLIVQFIDNNLFVPKIVASKVKINALVSIIVVLVGNALWGVPGMFLSIPLTAIVKVIFDRISPLQPFGFLLGDNQPDITREIFVVRRRVKTATIR